MYDAFGSVTVAEAVQDAELLSLSSSDEGLVGLMTSEEAKTYLEASKRSGAAPDSDVCVSYRLSSKDCSKISVSQASSLAYLLLQRHLTNELKNNIGSIVLALHCCKGLFDASDGPMCVLVGSNQTSTSTSFSATGGGNAITRRIAIGNDSGQSSVAVPDGGVWVLQLAFHDLQQWGEFVGLNRKHLIASLEASEQLITGRYGVNDRIHSLQLLISLTVFIAIRLEACLARLLARSLWPP